MEDITGLNNIEFILQDNFGEFSEKLIGLNDLEEFFIKEREYWGRNENIGFNNTLIRRCDEILKSINVLRITKDGEKPISDIISEIQRKVSEKYINGRVETPLIYSNTKIAEIYIKLASIDVNMYQYFFSAIRNDRNFNVSPNYKNFVGTISAAIYLGDISITGASSKYENNILRLLQDFEKSKNEFENNSKNSLNNFNEQFKEKRFSIEDWFNTEKKNIENEKNRIDKEFSDLKKSAEDRANENIRFFKEKLMLEEPVNHWENRATDLKKKNIKWVIGFTITVIVSIVFLTWILYNPPSIFHFTPKDGIKVDNIKGIILFISILSMIGIIIRNLSKVMFSNFHLIRDAEERKMLTYFYLSIRDDAKIEPQEKQLILQSLFSRADFGILSNDSGPTMPGFAELIKTVNGK